MDRLPISVEYYPSSVLTPQQVANVVSHDLVELLNHNLSDAVFRCNMNGEILYMNDAMQRLFEIPDFDSPTVINAKSFYKQRRQLAAVNRSLNGNLQCFTGEVELVKRSGASFFGHLNCRRVGRGAVFYIDGAIRDVSEEKETRTALKRQARIQELLLGISGDFLNADLENVESVIEKALGEMGLFIAVDRVEVHNYDFEDRTCTRTYRWNRIEEEIDPGESIVPIDLLQEMVDRHLKGEIIQVPVTIDMEESPMKQAVISQGIKGFITVPMHTQGACNGFLSLEVLVSQFPTLKTPALTMLRLLANMIASLSSRSASHQQLKKLVEEITLKSHQQKDFSFITSHHLRASVANLVAITDLMKQGHSERYMEMLAITSNKLNDTINSISSILQIELYDLLNKRPINIKSALSRVSENLKTVIAEHDADVIVRVDKGLEVAALPNYLEDILEELIKNAIRFGLTLENKQILIAGGSNHDEVQITVRDFGKGFDTKKHREKLFQVGARFHNSCHGQGLGLYLVKRQVQALDGNIEIDSIEGQGTTVKMVFPVIKVHL